MTNTDEPLRSPTSRSTSRISEADAGRIMSPSSDVLIFHRDYGLEEHVDARALGVALHAAEEQLVMAHGCAPDLERARQSELVHDEASSQSLRAFTRHGKDSFADRGRESAG